MADICKTVLHVLVCLTGAGYVVIYLYMDSIDACEAISTLNELNYSSIVVWAASTHSSHVLSRKHALIKIRG